MTKAPSKEVLTIFLGGSEEVSGLSFYGLTSDPAAHAHPPFPRSRWPMSPEPELTSLHGEGWRVLGWDLHIAAWPRGDAFREAVLVTLQGLIDAGCRVAWVGAEGIPFCDPPGLFDPDCMTGGVLAWLTSDGWFGCPLDPDRPLEWASDRQLLRLRRWAGQLATNDGGSPISVAELEARTHAVVRSLAYNLTTEEVRELDDLIDHGEAGVAFEMLCTQLYEHEWAVTAPAFATLNDLGDAFALRPAALSRWESTLRDGV